MKYLLDNRYIRQYICKYDFGLSLINMKLYYEMKHRYKYYDSQKEHFKHMFCINNNGFMYINKTFLSYLVNHNFNENNKLELVKYEYILYKNYYDSYDIEKINISSAILLNHNNVIKYIDTIDMINYEFMISHYYYVLCFKDSLELFTFLYLKDKSNVQEKQSFIINTSIFSGSTNILNHCIENFEISDIKFNPDSNPYSSFTKYVKKFDVYTIMYHGSIFDFTNDIYQIFIEIYIRDRNIESAKILADNGCGVFDYNIPLVACGNDIELLKCSESVTYLHNIKNNDQIISNALCEYVKNRNNLDMVYYLINSGYKIPCYSISKIMEIKNIKLIRLLAKKLNKKEITLDDNYHNMTLKMVKYFYKHNIRFSDFKIPNIMNSAIFYKKKKLVMFLYNNINNKELLDYCFREAYYQSICLNTYLNYMKNINMTKWLYKNFKINQSRNILLSHVIYLKYDEIDWLYKHIPNDFNSKSSIDSVLKKAAEYGTISIFQWIFDNNKPILNDTHYGLLFTAFNNHHFHIVNYLLNSEYYPNQKYENLYPNSYSDIYNWMKYEKNNKNYMSLIL